MDNIRITHSTSAYSDLPDDDKCRVVWWHGGIIKNPSHRSTVPLIEILFRILSTEQELLPESYSEIIRLPFSALDCFKIGSIWKGKENIGDLWELDGYSDNIEKNKLVELDFGHGTQSFIINSNDKYQVDIDDKLQSKSLEIPYIPKKIHPIIYDAFFKSKVFVWRSRWDSENKRFYTYLIPCAELFTSTYTPNLKDFRNRLLSRELNDALIKYIDFSRSERLDNEYKMKFLKGHYDTHTISCLTYLALNEDSRRKASEIFHSMQESYEGKSYLSTKPYHPTRLQLLVEGKAINSSTFLVTKISASSVPAEKKINIIPNVRKNKNTSATDNTLESGIKPQTNSHSSNVEIVSDQDPTNNSPEIYIKSPVVLIGDKPDISIGDTPIITNSGDIAISINEGNEISLIKASEGEPYGNYQSQIAQVRNTQPNNQVDQQNIFEDIYEALKYLKEKYQNFIEDISFINEKAESFSYFYLIDYVNLIEKRNRCQWGYERKFMIIKIHLRHPKRCIYLMEISRRGTSYRGLLFETSILDKDFLVSLVTQVTKKKGVVKEIQSVKGIYLYNYDHTLGKGSMSDKILRELRRYLTDERRVL